MGGYPEVKLENSVLVSSCHLNQSYTLFLTHHLFLFLIDVFLYVYPIIFGEWSSHVIKKCEIKKRQLSVFQNILLLVYIETDIREYNMIWYDII